MIVWFHGLLRTFHFAVWGRDFKQRKPYQQLEEAHKATILPLRKIWELENWLKRENSAPSPVGANQRIGLNGRQD